jgi:hypothetical protein
MEANFEPHSYSWLFSNIATKDYLLVINYNMSEDTLRKQVEPAMHLTAATMGFGTAISALVLNLFNNANLWCWIAPFPSGCLDSWRYGDEKPCSRGDNAWIFRWAFYFCPLWFCILFSIVTTAFVYRKVHKREKSARRHYNHASSVLMIAPTSQRSTSGAMISHVGTPSKSGSVSDATGDSFLRDRAKDPERIQTDDSFDEEPPATGEARRVESIMLENKLRALGNRNTTIKGPANNPRTREVFLQAIWFLAS